MNIDNQQPQQTSSSAHEWYRSLESVLSERRSIDAFRLWLRVQRKDDALDLYLAIIAFRKHARRNDQRASSIAFGICKRYISPRTGLCDFLPIQMRNDLTNKISNFKLMNHKPYMDLFDQIIPLAWAYLLEQHALFVCSKEFAAVMRATEQENAQLKMAELAAARNATANSRVPPLIGFGKYRVRESRTMAQHNSRPKSEPPGRRNHRNGVPAMKKDHENTGDQNTSEQSFPIIRHDRPEDRQLFVDIICKKLNDFNTNDQQRKPTTRTGFVERETDLTSDNNNNNEQRLIQRDFDEEFETPWDEENDAVPQEAFCDWSGNTNARIASAPRVFSPHSSSFFEHQKPQFHSQSNKHVHKSASLGFSNVGREFYDWATYPQDQPFIKDQLYAVHKHLVAPLSNKYAYHHVSRDRFPPPPPAPNRPEQLNNNGTYQQQQQFSDSSGFCSSESAHFQFTESEPRRQYWIGSRIPRDNSFPFEASQQFQHPTIPSFCSPQPPNDRQLVVTYKDDVTGVPFVARLEPRPLFFRDFRKCFGVPANTNKRFLFKSVCEDASARYQWNIIFDDMALLPVFEGKITAECRSLTDVD